DTSDAQTFVITITKPDPWYNVANHLDVDGDKRVTPSDLVVLISRLNGFGAADVPANPPFGPPYYDVDNDHIVAPRDLVLIIIHLNAFGAGEGEGSGVGGQGSGAGDQGSGQSGPSVDPPAADSLLAQLDPLS